MRRARLRIRGLVLEAAVTTWPARLLAPRRYDSVEISDSNVSNYEFTPYFENEVLGKRSYLTKEMCIRVVQAPIRVEPQEGNRFRFWAAVPELGGRYLRVITLADQLTIHNAFPDRRFKP